MAHLLMPVSTLDTTFKETLMKNIAVMGTISKLWHALESAAAASQDEAELITKELLNLVQRTVIFTVQTNN